MDVRRPAEGERAGPPAPGRWKGRACGRWVLGLLAAAAFLPTPGSAFTNVAVGEPVENVELPALDGGRRALLSREALANVFVFFRPRQEHSLTALKAMALCEKDLSGKRVHWAAVVSSSWDPQEVRAMVKEAGIRMPVLVDEGDALYGRMGVRLHPVIGIADDKLRLVAYEPFHKINYCDRIRGKVRYALGEIDQAEMKRSEEPPRALFPNEIKGAAANRRVRMGEGFLRMKEWEKAAAEARRVLETDPLHAQAHLLLGDALAAQGKCPQAEAEYAAARRLDAAAAAGRKGTCPPR